MEKAGNAEERFMELANLGRDPSELSREPDVPVGLKVIYFATLDSALDLQSVIQESGSYMLCKRISSGRPTLPRCLTPVQRFSRSGTEIWHSVLVCIVVNAREA
jgi:hypothetical protein